MIQITKIGNWSKTLRIIRNLQGDIRAAGIQSLYNFAKKAESIAVGHIANQDLGWKPLAPYTVAKKLRHGMSDLTLIESSTYYQAITSWVTKESAYVGIKRNTTEPDGTPTYSVAKLQEYGDTGKKIPTRPLWKPTLDEAIAWQRANNNPATIFIANLRAKYGI